MYSARSNLNISSTTEIVGELKGAKTKVHQTIIIYGYEYTAGRNFERDSSSKCYCHCKATSGASVIDARKTLHQQYCDIVFGTTHNVSQRR